MATAGRPTRRRRLRVEAIASGIRELESAKAHYLRDVLRLGEGARLEVFDGKGNKAEAHLTSVGPTCVRLDVGAAEQDDAPHCALTLYVAPPKGERADWLVEKSTELGVARIVWIETARSITVPEPGSNKAQRWQRLAESAATQCGRSTVPILEGPVRLADILATREPEQLRLVGDFAGPPIVDLLVDAPSSVGCLVGPEGGLTADELAHCDRARWLRASLAPHVLRVETAAVAACAQVMGVSA